MADRFRLMKLTNLLWTTKWFLGDRWLIALGSILVNIGSVEHINFGVLPNILLAINSATACFYSIRLL